MSLSFYIRASLVLGSSWSWIGSSAAEPAGSSAAASPLREVRAIWVARWDFKSAADVRSIVSNCAAVGLNRIYLQVRGRGDAFYASALEPWGEDLGGDPARDGHPGFDPLQVALETARRHRIQLFAWVNVLPAWKGSAPPRSRKHLVHRHPEWFLMTRGKRRLLLDGSGYTILNPCLPEVRDYLCGVIGDIASRYPVDGIQLDYIRFQERPVRPDDDAPYDPETLARFKKISGGFPARYPEAWKQFRTQAVNRLVEGISARVHAARPDAVLSIAAIQNFDFARENYFQDAARWVDQGWAQEVCPMSYAASLGDFQNTLSRIAARLPGRTIVPGIGLYLLPSGQEASRQLAYARGRGSSGYALFSYSSCFASSSPYLARDAKAARLREEFRRLVESANTRVVKAP